MLERAAQWCHVVSAFWVVALAVIIFIDVGGRFIFNTPLLGAPEIIKNSVVSIAFLQLPLAIRRGRMLRSTLLLDLMTPRVRQWCGMIASTLGLAFFIAIAYSSWQPFVESWLVGEYEGEGALRVPTYPVRFLLVAASLFAAAIYLQLLYTQWSEPPGSASDSTASDG